MGDSKKYLIVNDHTSIRCKTRIARVGDTVSEDECLKPGILEALAVVGKVKEAGKATDDEVKANEEKALADKEAADKKEAEEKAAKEKADKEASDKKSRDEKAAKEKAAEKKIWDDKAAKKKASKKNPK